MLTLEQVRLLEQRVQKIVQRLTELQRENTSLQDEVHRLRASESTLMERVASFDTTQAEIESGILSALQRLDEVEDAVAEGDAESRSIVVEAPAEPDLSEDSDPEEEVAPEAEVEAEAEVEEKAQAGPELDIF